MNIPSWSLSNGADVICLAELKLGFIAQVTKMFSDFHVKIIKIKFAVVFGARIHNIDGKSVCNAIWGDQP